MMSTINTLKQTRLIGSDPNNLNFEKKVVISKKASSLVCNDLLTKRLKHLATELRSLSNGNLFAAIVINDILLCERGAFNFLLCWFSLLQFEYNTYIEKLLPFSLLIHVIMSTYRYILEKNKLKRNKITVNRSIKKNIIRISF